MVNAELRKFLPKKLDAKWLNSNFGLKAYDVHACHQFLTNPVWDILDRGGKRWRPLLMLLAHGAVGGDPKKIRKFTVLPELIHNASLIADDIEDNSDTRRDKPTLHMLYGLDVAVNVSTLLYGISMLVIKRAKLSDSTKRKIYEVVCDELINLHIGQGTDIIWHNRQRQVSENMYFAMCANKTGAIARLAVKIGVILGNGHSDQAASLGKYAEGLGIAFQIQDDVLNLKGGIGKRKGEDITEGKMSLPVIRTLEKAGKTDKNRLLQILKKHTQNAKDIETAIGIINRYDSLNYSTKVAKKIINKAWIDTEYRLPASEYKNRLKELGDFAITRKI